MKDTLKVGSTKSCRNTIDEKRTIGFMGDDCRVYSTPNLLNDIETLCRDFLLEHSDENEDSVGTRVELEHTGPTLLSMWVELTATVTEIKGPAIIFDIVAKDALQQVANCKHSRYVVDVESTIKRLKGKLAKAQQQEQS